MTNCGFAFPQVTMMRDKTVGEHRPSIWDERNAANAESLTAEAGKKKALAGKVRTAMGRDADPTGARRMARAMMRDMPSLAGSGSVAGKWNR